MDQTTRLLARIVQNTRIERVPATAVDEAIRRVIDSIACAAGAFDEPYSAKMRRIASSAGPGPARIWGTGLTSSIEMAGFANGSMVRYLDLSDTWLGKTAGHPSDMIAPLIALAEAKGASGKRLLEAILIAYELYCGLCDATSLQEASIDQSTAAALGAAGGAAAILELDEDAAGNALALALCANVNLYNVRRGTLSDWKANAGPNAARAGVFAASLAAEGVTGPTGAFDGPAGLAAMTGPLDWRFETATAPKILSTHLKAYPVCYHGQSAVDSAQGLAPELDARLIEEVQINTYKAAVNAMGADASRWAPTTRETADHSLPYTVAVTLRRGQLRSSDYAADQLREPQTLALMQKIKVSEDPAFTAGYPAAASCRITLRTTDGRQLSAERIQPKGHAQNPLTDGELAAKLQDLWPQSWPQHGDAAVLASCRALPESASIAALVQALTGQAD